MRTRILIIFIILLPFLGINCKKANNDEEYRKLIIGSWTYYYVCGYMGEKKCFDIYTFYENGYYGEGPNNIGFYQYYIENGHLYLTNDATFKTDNKVFVREDYTIEKMVKDPLRPKDLVLKDNKTGETLTLMYNGK